MTFWGITPTGDRLALGDPMEITFSWDRDAPADLLRAKFPADRLWEELKEVLLYRQGELAFRGVVDEQNAALSSTGLTVELVCRSLEALLLDNEALPEVLNSPSLPLLEEKLLRPLGLSLGKGDRETKRGRLVVDKGDSCWTVLESFCGTFLGTFPWVDPEGRVQCEKEPERRLELANVISAQVGFFPCKRVSEVWRQSCRGLYDTPYRSGRPGAVRRRYLSRESGQEPRALLAQGERESFSLTVTCAGAWQPGRNTLASVDLPGVGRLRDCPVQSALYRRDKSGERTWFILDRPQTEKGDTALCG